jgi:hypothetical protein
VRMGNDARSDGREEPQIDIQSAVRSAKATPHGRPLPPQETAQMSAFELDQALAKSRSEDDARRTVPPDGPEARPSRAPGAVPAPNPISHARIGVVVVVVTLALGIAALVLRGL